MSNASKPISLKDFYNQSDMEDDQSNNSIDSQELDKVVAEKLRSNVDDFKRQITQLPIQSYPIQRSPIEQFKLSKDAVTSPSFKPEDKEQDDMFVFRQDIIENTTKPIGDRIRSLRQKSQQNRSQSPSLNLLDQFISVCKSKIDNKYEEGKQSAILEVDNQYDPSELKQYLEFKEQIQVKRLSELSQIHEDFLRQLTQEKKSILQSVERQIDKVNNLAQDILKKQKEEINEQIRSLQHEIVEISYKPQQNKMKFNDSPVKPIQNRFSPLLLNLRLLKDKINHWSNEPQDFNQIPRQSSLLPDKIKLSPSAKKSIYIQHSPLRVKPIKVKSPIRKSPGFRNLKSTILISPLRRSPEGYFSKNYNQASLPQLRQEKDISYLQKDFPQIQKDNFSQLQDMIKDIQRSQKTQPVFQGGSSQQNNYKKITGQDVDRILNVQSKNFDLQPERGRKPLNWNPKTPGWNELLQKSEYFSSRSRSNGKDYSEGKKFRHTDIRNRRGTLQLSNTDNVGRALQVQSNQFYKFTK